VVLTATLALVFPGLGRTAPPVASQALPGANATTEETPEAHLGKGYDALKLDRYDVAVSEFRAALEIDPKLVLRARFPLAVALFEQLVQLEAIAAASMRSDLQVARLMAAAGARGSLANVEINLDSLHDVAYVSKVRNKVASLRERLEKNPVV